MKKHWSAAIGLFLMLSAGSVFGATDPVWMFTDRDDLILTYSDFQYCDTTRVKDYNCTALKSDQIPDSGSSYNGTKYINLDYQFTQDTFKIINEFSKKVDYKDFRPGFAGFKTAWDGGMVGYTIPRFKYFVFAHKGPNTNHKVTVKTWFNDGACGSPSYQETIGTFSASPTWKLDTIVIPENMTNKIDSVRNTSIYFELVFIITNLDSKDTTSGAPGSLKIDNICLVGRNPVDTSPKPQQVAVGQPATFKVYAKPSKTADVLTYQWMKDGEPIADAASATYTIESAQLDQAGLYTAAVTVSTSGLTYNSHPAALSVGGNAVINLRKTNGGIFSISSGPNGTILINASMKQNTPVTIGLYSMDGKTLIESTLRTLQAGNSTYAIGNNLKSSGAYVVKITGSNINISRKILVSK